MSGYRTHTAEGFLSNLGLMIGICLLKNETWSQQLTYTFAGMGDRTGEVQAAMRDVGYGGPNWA